ncbi:hypothetical protein ABW20_dc0106385 [Dactylellina cionopaga]|nr:hypothetical protein ABW20_dc0106385 [Dactylellina cionopaga]
MPPKQHTFGTTGNMPSYPGAGAPQVQAQPRPESTNPYYQVAGPSSPRPAPLYTPPVVSPSPGPHVYNFSSPQTPAPAYTPFNANDSPDLLAARRELLDIEAQIQRDNDNLNNRLNESNRDPSAIEFFQEEVRKLYIRKGALQQQIQDLQNPNSYAYQQSQAMTANPASESQHTPLVYAAHLESNRFNAATLTQAVKSNASRFRCIWIVFVVSVIPITIIILYALNKAKKH